MTLYIIIVTIILSVIGFSDAHFFYRLAFNAYAVHHQKEFWRFFTHGFLHVDYLHLIFNMLVLALFGTPLEDYYFQAAFAEKANYYFALLYIGGLVISSLPDYIKHKNNIQYNSVGASGAVSAIVFSFILFNPISKVYLFGILGLPAIFGAVMYIIYSVYMSQKGNDNINHNAHIVGSLFGIIYTIALDYKIAIHFFNELLQWFV